MDEELMDIVTEDNIEVKQEEGIDTNVTIEDEEYDVPVSDDIETVEAEMPETIEIEIEESIGWVGGDSTRHYSLYGRDEPDQHPITAITGLREELDNIEALGVVYSDRKNQANYYLWKDGNPRQEDRVGYFVRACSDINEVEICTTSHDIFGVTVDDAGFVGGQDDIPRDTKYCLVVTNGIVHVRCESTVDVGDYVISNAYGYATKNQNGYKVAGIHKINGVDYAEITLVTPIGRICDLTDNVDNLNARMDDAEQNIVAAINVANEAYKKAGEAGSVSEDAIKNALEALERADGVVEEVVKIEQNVSSSKEIAEQAKAISQSAEVAAKRAKDEAVSTANNALSNTGKTQDNLNEFINEMTPLTQWEGDNGSGIVGFVARANADSATLATLAEWKEEGGESQSIAGAIAKVNEHEAILDHITSHQGVNGSTIAQVEQKADENGASITNLVASVDKYSVGEYSQAYGLTKEQAENILKQNYLYIPTEDHSETFVHDDEVNEFTTGNYYVWTGSDWKEHDNGVIFQSSPPSNSAGTYEYWYLDSNDPMGGYEAYALYVWDTPEDGVPHWKKVNTLVGNVNNRITSMIRQTVDGVALEVTNARGSAATLGLRLTETESEIQSLALWSKGGVEDGEPYNLATIKQTADDAGASIAQVVESVGKDGKVNAASIVTAINSQGDSGVKIAAEFVNIDAGNIGLAGQTIQLTADNIKIESDNFNVDSEGNIIAKAGTIGGVKISGGMIKSDQLIPTTTIESWSSSFYGTMIDIQDRTFSVMGYSNTDLRHNFVYEIPQEDLSQLLMCGESFQINMHGYSSDDWYFISPEKPESNGPFILYAYSTGGDCSFNLSVYDFDPMYATCYLIHSTTTSYDYSCWPTYESHLKFCIYQDGTLSVTGAQISGEITAGSGSFSGHINATSGSIGGVSLNNGGLRGGIHYTNAECVDSFRGSLINPTNSTFEVDNYKDPDPTLWHNYVYWIPYCKNKLNIYLKKSDSTEYFITSQLPSGDGKYSFKSLQNSKSYYTGASSNQIDGDTGGYYIIQNSLYEKDVLNPDVLYEGACNFSISPDGIIAAQGVIISGDIYANNGVFRGDVYAKNGTFEGKVVADKLSTFGGTLSAGTLFCSDSLTIDTWSTTGYSRIVLDDESAGITFTPSDYEGLILFGGGSLGGSWSGGSGICTNSDKKLKHQIETIPLEYENLLDNLNPVRYKYNDGTSDRYHTGFIAQEVAEALDKVNIDSKDFAGLVIFNKGEENERWTLRYEEFIALNTAAIQKLKSRVAELEEKVEKLEALVKE